MGRVINRLILFLLITGFLAEYAMAAERLVIVQVTDGANVKTIAEAYDGRPDQEWNREDRQSKSRLQAW